MRRFSPALLPLIRLPAAVALALALAVAGAPAAGLPQAGDPTFRQAEAALAGRLAAMPGAKRARNVILFIADGMGIELATAIRIASGQLSGLAGEEAMLSWEAFPGLALAKTWNTDAQIPDSAGTATAMLTGIKTRKGVLGVGPAAVRGDCASGLAHPAETLGEIAAARGLAVGIVTTSRLTHATPAAVYAHSANRDWEDDAALPPGAPCVDIARQLAAFPFTVAMGGGRQMLLPEGVLDIERAPGRRRDGRDLIAEWRDGGPGRTVLHTRAEFDRLAETEPERVLGIFSPSHMAYDVDRDADWGGEPSLAEMTRAAIRLLARDPEGYFLMVEGGLIDVALHGNDVNRAITDGLAFDRAVAAAAAMTDPAETLIIVTSDHDHRLPPLNRGPRGSAVAGLAGWDPALNPPPVEHAPQRGAGPLPVAPGAAVRSPVPAPGAVRGAASPAALPPGGHGAADVAVFARGPMAGLFSGTVEQNYIFHVMRHALRLGAGD